MKSHSLISLSLSLSKLLNLFISVSLYLIVEKLDVESIVNVLINHCFHCCTNFFLLSKAQKVWYTLTQLSFFFVNKKWNQKSLL